MNLILLFLLNFLVITETFQFQKNPKLTKIKCTSDDFDNDFDNEFGSEIEKMLSDKKSNIIIPQITGVRIFYPKGNPPPIMKSYLEEKDFFF